MFDQQIVSVAAPHLAESNGQETPQTDESQTSSLAQNSEFKIA